MAVSYRYANLDEYPRISRFLNDYWAENHIYVRDENLFKWAFNRPSQWPEQGLSWAVAEDGAELVGILAGIPFSFNQFGTRAQGVWIANYVIRPDYRKGSTALQLLSMFRRPSFQAVIAFGINPATATIYKVLRGEVLPQIPRHFLVLPEAAGRMANLLEIAHPDWTKERAAAMAEAFRLVTPQQPAPAVEFGIPAGWDEKDWPEIAATTVGAARDSEYLTWRYMQHPTFTYRIVTVRDGSRTGLLVWRLETIRRATPEGRVDVDRIGRLVEFLPASPGNAEALFSAFIHELRAADAIGADFYGYHSATRELLTSMGFHEAAAHPDGEAIPSRFQPLDGKGGGIMSALFVQDATSPAGAAEGACPWYWTKSDSDQDRPN
jgi:hypothetical protein